MKILSTTLLIQKLKITILTRRTEKRGRRQKREKEWNKNKINVKLCYSTFDYE